jgi:alpha-L-rhamnosidase
MAGYRNFSIKPVIVGDLTWVKAHCESVYGRIESNWQRKGDQLSMDIIVPPNTTATVFVPSRSASTVTESGKSAVEAEDVKFLRMENNAAVYTVGSGTYMFRSSLPAELSLSF